MRERPDSVSVLKSGTLTRDTKPVMAEVENIETIFKQELINPSVRDRVYPEGRELTEQFYADLVLQLNAAQKTAVYFEKEAATWMGEAWRLSNERARLAENVIPTMQAKLDRLEKPGFWRRFWNACNRKGFATSGD